MAIATALPVPLSAVQLLWLNLVTNGIQHIALAFERGEPGILERRPRPPGESLFERRMVTQVVFVGVYMGTAACAFYAWCLAAGMSEAVARNLLLLLMVLFENVHVLNARSETRSIFGVPMMANPFLILAIIGAQGVHIFKCSRTDYLEAAYIGEIRRYLNYLMKTEPPVRAVLDLAEAQLLSSEAIGLIVALGNVLQETGGGLHLANISEETRSVLAIANLQDVLAMYTSVDDAVSGF